MNKLFAPSLEQQRAIKTIIDGDDGIYCLVGEAGVGKTITTANLISRLEKSDKRYTLTATTNEAVNVLNSTLGNISESAKTIHKALGFTMRYINYEQVLVHSFSTSIEPFLIIDEFSMLDNRIWKKIIEKKSNGEIKKILLIGDPVQLPEIGEKISYGNELIKIELINQMRQTQVTSAQKLFFKTLRTAIETNSSEIIDFVELSKGTNINFITDFSEFTKIYNEDSGNKRILAYYNKSVEKYNDTIKSIGKASFDKFNIGDIVVINKPIYSTSEKDHGKIVNNELVEITDIHDDSSNNRFIIDIRSVTGVNKSVHNYYTIKDEENFFNTVKATGDKDLYEKLHSRTTRLKHMYSSTVHKAQGKSIENIYIDGRDIEIAHNRSKCNSKYSNGISYNMFLRLLYVGISRMKSNSFVYIGKHRDYDKFKK